MKKNFKKFVLNAISRRDFAHWCRILLLFCLLAIAQMILLELAKQFFWNADFLPSIRLSLEASILFFFNLLIWSFIADVILHFQGNKKLALGMILGNLKIVLLCLIVWRAVEYLAIGKFGFIVCLILLTGQFILALLMVGPVKAVPKN